MKALVLAHLIINFAREQGRPVSNLQLQKLMYFCQLASYKSIGKRLIDDYCFEVWRFGPVIPGVYYQYAMYGSMPIGIHYSETEKLPAFAAKTVYFWINRWPGDLVRYAKHICSSWKQMTVANGKFPIPEEIIEREAALYSEN
ncbi:MAG: DUF4065 domain-containing protein [Proteobacteria bacterium]|uniref:DUF4065 domain-containing protein n=1 Tax=Candidatus Avisuccinivibrio stercorigallinarum TaxID=2840704 RepID=A0A9D9GT79_9GAMM|nr:DUF4065 domain-containing protein [Candidatus Avisuccinivibrio stercorigallinarum]